MNTILTMVLLCITTGLTSGDRKLVNSLQRNRRELERWPPIFRWDLKETNKKNKKHQEREREDRRFLDYGDNGLNDGDLDFPTDFDGPPRPVIDTGDIVAISEFNRKPFSSQEPVRVPAVGLSQPDPVQYNDYYDDYYYDYYFDPPLPEGPTRRPGQPTSAPTRFTTRGSSSGSRFDSFLFPATTQKPRLTTLTPRPNVDFRIQPKGRRFT